MAYCTHAVLSGSALENIRNSQLDELVVTDTIPLSDEARKIEKIRQLTIADLLAESMRSVSNEESISALFSKEQRLTNRLPRRSQGCNALIKGVMTMSDQFELNAEVREDIGKGASRRLRRLADQVPAIIYGGDKDPSPADSGPQGLEKALENEAFYSHVLTINVRLKYKKLSSKTCSVIPPRTASCTPTSCA